MRKRGSGEASSLPAEAAAAAAVDEDEDASSTQLLQPQPLAVSSLAPVQMPACPCRAGSCLEPCTALCDVYKVLLSLQ